MSLYVRIVFPQPSSAGLKTGVIDIPVVNVYTDFFINDIWGKRGIDYHLVSDVSMKKS